MLIDEKGQKLLLADSPIARAHTTNNLVMAGGATIFLLIQLLVLRGFCLYCTLHTFTAWLALPVIQIASIGTQITEAFAGLDRIHEIMTTPREDADDANRMQLADLRGDIEFDNVSFEYNAGVRVLNQVSFTARAGSASGATMRWFLAPPRQRARFPAVAART